jgi:hypothetical protein
MKVENDVNVLHEEGSVAMKTDEVFMSTAFTITKVKLEVSIAFRLFL